MNRTTRAARTAPTATGRTNSRRSGRSDRTLRDGVQRLVGALVPSRRLRQASESDAAATDRFRLMLELELERARRHERPFSLSRFDFGGDVESAAEIMSRLGGTRICDAGVVANGEATILWSETAKESAANAIDRLVSVLPDGSRVAVRTVEFPDDGLSLVSLLSALDDGSGTMFQRPSRTPRAAAGLVPSDESLPPGRRNGDVHRSVDAVVAPSSGLVGDDGRVPEQRSVGDSVHARRATSDAVAGP